AVAGVLTTVLQMLEEGSTHLGVATDHVIESFRNELWSGYKTGDGIDPALRAQFEPLEEALRALGIPVWAMVQLEADDALATAARIACDDPQVQQVRIWTPDKDLAQCGRGGRSREIRRGSPAHSRLPGVGRRQRGWLPWHPGHRRERCGRSDRASWPDRGLCARCAR